MKNILSTIAVIFLFINVTTNAQDITNTLAPNGNFKVVREITANGKPFSMPYMGIINKDLTFVAENNDLKTIVGIEGRLVLEILQLQQLLIEYRALTPKCRLANILHQQKSVTSDQQIVLSNRVNLCPIPLGRTTPSLCMSLLEVYAEKKLPLKVRYNGEEKVGFDAIESVFDWLKESLKNGVITDNQVIGALIEKMFGLPDANSFIQIQQAKFLRWLNLEYRKEETLTYLLNKIQIRDEENNQRRANSTVSSPSSSFSRSRPQSN